MRMNRREFLYSTSALSGHLGHSADQGTRVATPSWRLWYRQPAKRWLDSLPVGNGRLGAMVFGSPERNVIALNESTVWSGGPSASGVNPLGRQHLTKIRELLFQGESVRANELSERYLTGRESSYGTHLPLANLVITDTRQRESEVKNFRRSLDLDTGIAKTEYEWAGTRYRTEVFASNPDDVIVLRLSADQPDGLSFSFSLDPGELPGEASLYGTDTLILGGSAWEKRHSNGSTGVNFQAWVRAIAQGGRVSGNGDRLEIQRADSVILLIAAQTNYGVSDLFSRCERQLKQAAGRPFETLVDRHTADHRRLFSRVQIDLGGSDDGARATDERLAAVKGGASDPHLAALFFQYGRYLLIAGSRENSPLPMNLQGIWNDGLAAKMQWTCDFHLDINTQQNYWPTEVCNLSECGEPLFRLLEKLAKNGRKTAAELYGARGWVCHVYTNAWGFTAPGRGLQWGPFVTGGIWTAWHLWEHFLFRRDRTFLANRAYPVLKSAAEFFLDYMVEHPRKKHLVTGPSISAENLYLSADGKPCSVSMGPTCDTQLVRALFASCSEASRLLDVDGEFRTRLESAAKQLAPTRIGQHGQIMEWLEDYGEAEPNHRHTSHLVALFPLDQISPARTPDLARAARVTLTRRTKQANWEDVEWSRANLINYFARLLDAEEAHKHVVGLLKEDTDNNLLTFSRAGIAGAEENIFAVDGNTAGSAGIAEMLLQTHDGIHFLPALPKAWPNGSVSGLRARGGFEVSMAWQAGELISATIKSADEAPCQVRYGDRAASLTLRRGGSIKLDRELRQLPE